ncbi:hypothetical protein [Paenibacillus sp. DYY-L-2]|uniref:hypothetical protein n=1 Tax=Paenibacillus sp. DYY-L-2 TaxID=3447013 RepID=UPI003F504017
MGSIIERIDLAAAQMNYKEIERLINAMDLSDQLEIHSLLNSSTIKAITKNKNEIHIDSSVKEHMIWFYFHGLSWSDKMLDQLIQIYNEEHYLALESIVIRAIKTNEVKMNQIDRMESAFSSKEFQKQIKSWKQRNGLA